ncbi:MAG: TolC family protein [Bacteroidota bacterium]
MKALFSRIALLLFCSSIPLLTRAQDQWTLSAVLQLAQRRTLSVRLADQNRRIAERDWQQFRRSNRPRIRLNGSLPNFSSAFREVTQPDGSIQFNPVRNNNSFLGLQVEQNIPLTGGILQADFAFQRFDDFAERSQQYFVQPFSLTYFQPFFRSNPQKWDRQIAPRQRALAEQQYRSQRNDADQLASGHYFNVLIQEQRLNIARDQQEVAQQLLRIAQKRYELGQLTKSDLLQLDIQSLQAEQNIQTRELAFRQARENLELFLQKPTDGQRSLHRPELPPVLAAEVEPLVRAALQRDPQLAELEIQLLQNRQRRRDLRSERGWQAGLLASMGWSKSGEQLGEALNAPKLQQQVSLSFALPLVDWGDYRQERRQLEDRGAQIEQRLTFRQQELQLATTQALAQYHQLRAALATAQRTEQLTSERFRIVKEQFLHDKISLIELTAATTEKEQAQVQYLTLLRDCWQRYLSLNGVLQ